MMYFHLIKLLYKNLINYLYFIYDIKYMNYFILMINKLIILSFNSNNYKLNII